MARRVYLHIGTMKSATTYLQGLLDANADTLAAGGLLWQGQDANFSAVTDLLGKQGRVLPPRVGWRDFAKRIVDHPADALVSNELLSFRNQRSGQRVIDGLSPTQVEVIVTARDLGRGVASQWQERARNQPMTSWFGFMDQLMADDTKSDPDLAWFWRRQDLVKIIETWGGLVGVDHVTVVTVPPPGGDRGLVARRFASVIQVDGLVELAVARGHNPTLGATSSEFMRRVQDRLTDADRARLASVLKHVLVRRVLARRSKGEPSIGLSREQYEWVLAQARATIVALAASSAQVVGDPEDLLPQWPDEPAASDPEDTSSDELLEVALDAVIGLAESLERQAHAAGEGRYAESVRQWAAADEPST